MTSKAFTNSLRVAASSLCEDRQLARFFMKEATTHDLLSFLTCGKLVKRSNLFSELFLVSAVKESVAQCSCLLEGIVEKDVVQDFVDELETLEKSVLQEGIRSWLASKLGWKIAKKAALAGALAAVFHTTGIPIATGILVALLIYAAYKIFTRYFSKAARACWGKSGKERALCILSYKVNALKAQERELLSSMSLCSKAKQPEKCREAIRKKISKVRDKIDRARSEAAVLRLEF